VYALLWLIVFASVFFSVGMVLAKWRGSVTWIDWSWLLAFVVIILLIGFWVLWLVVADVWP
jgi:hypothetical protein